MKKIAILSMTSLIGLTLLGGSLSAFANDQQMKPSAMGDQGFKSLDLTAEQKKQVQKIHAASQSQLKSLKADMHKNDQALAKLAVSTDADQAKISDLSNQQGKLIGQAIAIKTSNTNKIYNILTADQQQKFKTMLEQRNERMNKMMGNMRHGEE